MTSRSCNEISEKLVDYADGDLWPPEATEIAEHLATCERCRTTLKALQRSLHLAHVVWEDAEKGLDEIRIPATTRMRRLHLSRPALIAASLVLLAAGALVLHLLLKPARSIPGRIEELTVADMERAVNRTGLAFQLLAAADLLAEQPGGEAIAQERYLYITTAYPEVEAAAEAKLRLRSLSEGRVLQ